jgi:hypothetical protein
MLEVLSEDYIRTARAKGLSPLRVVGLHALRNAMIPVITTIGLQIGVMLAGAILTETIFSWPGIGKWMVDSVFRRDYPVIQGGLLLIAGIIMVVNLIVDLLYGLINRKSGIWIRDDGSGTTQAITAARLRPCWRNSGPFGESRRCHGLFFSIASLIAVFDVVAPHRPTSSSGMPSAAFWQAGALVSSVLIRWAAILSRLIFGSRYSLFIGDVVSVSLSSAFSACAGYFPARSTRDHRSWTPWPSACPGPGPGRVLGPSLINMMIAILAAPLRT